MIVRILDIVENKAKVWVPDLAIDYLEEDPPNSVLVDFMRGTTFSYDVTVNYTTCPNGSYEIRSIEWP